MFSRTTHANVTCSMRFSFPDRLLLLRLWAWTAQRAVSFHNGPCCFANLLFCTIPKGTEHRHCRVRDVIKVLKIQITACFTFLRKPTHGTCDLISIFTMSLTLTNMKQCLYFLVIPHQHLCNETKIKLWLYCQIKKDIGDKNLAPDQDYPLKLGLSRILGAVENLFCKILSNV